MEISFIIVNWNTKDLLRGCLDSIAKTAGSLLHEIIVVDNASSDGSADMLTREYPSVRLIANSENRGFGAANNQGFAVMKGKYALLINTDAVLTEGAAGKLWSFAEANPRAAIVRGQALKEVSLFDERYFFFFEETDQIGRASCRERVSVVV